MISGIPTAVNYCFWHYPPSGGCYRLFMALLLSGQWHYYYSGNGNRGVAFATLPTHLSLHIWSYGGINIMCMLFILALMLTLHRVLIVISKVLTMLS